MNNEPKTPMPAGVPKAADARSFQFGEIRRSLAFLDRIDPEDARNLFAMICRIPLSRNLGEVGAFIDHVWFYSRNAEFRTGSSRITGVEMDKFRDRLDLAVKELLMVTRELAHRAGLTEIILRHRRILARNGLFPVAVPDGPPRGKRPIVPVSKVV